MDLFVAGFFFCKAHNFSPFFSFFFLKIEEANNIKIHVVRLNVAVAMKSFEEMKT